MRLKRYVSLMSLVLLSAPAIALGQSFRGMVSGTEPPGASLGPATFLGQGISFVPLERKNGLARRYVLSLERELPGRVLVDVAFVRNVSYDMHVEVDLGPFHDNS